MEKHAEILAPAGGEAQLRAAVLCGADAVYLGLRGFNARAGAENFDENTLPLSKKLIVLRICSSTVRFIMKRKIHKKRFKSSA